MGTGCCFNRQAFYGYYPVLTDEDLKPNIIVKSSCGSRKREGMETSNVSTSRELRRE